MTVTYKHNDQQVTLHWDQLNDIWIAKCESLIGLSLKANSFDSMLKILGEHHHEVLNSMRLFISDQKKLYI